MVETLPACDYQAISTDEPTVWRVRLWANGRAEWFNVNHPTMPTREEALESLWLAARMGSCQLADFLADWGDGSPSGQVEAFHAWLTACRIRGRLKRLFGRGVP